MKLLEVEVGEELSTKRNAIRNFKGREVIVKHKDGRPKKGIIVSCQDKQSYILQVPTNRLIAWFYSKETSLTYESLERMQVVNPKVGDDLRTREGYHEVTQETIAMTVDWAKRGL